MTYDFSNELKKQELENTKDILNIWSYGEMMVVDIYAYRNQKQG